jgi:3-methyl-2-oxobutanoate hydroxymethyltransferase
MVKIEGAGFKLDVIRYLVEREIPVCSHLGLTPQSVLRLGGYRVQGRGDAARQLVEDAKAVVAAGASMIVLECLPTPVAAEVTAAVSAPTIGIGAGPHCDGQVLVLHDFLGLDSGHRVRAYADAVRDGSFPDAEHAYAS